LQTLPDGMPTGSAVANLSILGYDPRQFFEGRAVFEAANQKIELMEDDIAIRCNFISVENGKIKNHSADHISTDEAKTLIKSLNEKLGSDKIKFFSGVGYRNLIILHGKEFSKEIECTPPHDILGKKIEEFMVKGNKTTSKKLNSLIIKSNEILENHPINLERIKRGKHKANYIWPWSPGKKPNMKKYIDIYGKKGAVISAVDLINGIGVYAGFDVIRVKGATGLYDTNYEGKADAVIQALKNYDFVFCHVEASDEAGHDGDVKLKIKTIENLDNRLISNILKRLDEIDDDVSIAVLPDHFTPCKLKTHTTEPVPFLIWNSNKKSDMVEKYNEETCKKASLGLLKGDEFIREFFS